LGRTSAARMHPYIGSTTKPPRCQEGIPLSGGSGRKALPFEHQVANLRDRALAGNIFLISFGHPGLPVVAVMDEYPVAKHE